MDYLQHGALLLSGAFGALYFYERSLRKAAQREQEVAWNAAQKNAEALDKIRNNTETLRSQLAARSRGLMERVENALQKMEPNTARLAARRIFDEWLRENDREASSPADEPRTGTSAAEGKYTGSHGRKVRPARGVSGRR